MPPYIPRFGDFLYNVYSVPSEEEDTQPLGPKKSYPHKCPVCKCPAFIGLNQIRCSYLACIHHE
jgi:hypothetical protein